ncbi:MAG TPA: glycosyltransferase [Ilumatobacter sp.]|nr:glycosyltransferase [Ilumatobacter sp.]
MTSAIVVPCYDEAARFDAGNFEQLAQVVDRLVLVDDGSSDRTPALLDQVAERAPGGAVTVIHLARNRGKAEAVRAGMQAAVTGGASIVGYVDADFATPVPEVERLLAVITKDPRLEAVLASRVALLGHSIRRKATRHYLGRLYATAASLALDVAVYDTQCGAKLFRVSDTLGAALVDPFPDRWSFDVELLARLLHPARGLLPIGAGQIVEVPLREWHDVGGSKLHTLPAARSLLALAGVRRRIAARRTVTRAVAGGAAEADR